MELTDAGRALFDISWRQSLSRLLELESDVAIVAHVVERAPGIGIVADFEFVTDPRLSTIRIKDGAITTEYRVACLTDRQYSRKIKTLLNAVVYPHKQNAGFA